MRFSLRMLLLVVLLIAAALGGWLAYERRDHSDEFLQYLRSKPELNYEFDPIGSRCLFVTLSGQLEWDHLTELLNRSTFEHVTLTISGKRTNGLAPNRLSIPHSIRLAYLEEPSLNSMVNPMTKELALTLGKYDVQEAKTAFTRLEKVVIEGTKFGQGHFADLLQHNKDYQLLTLAIPLDERTIDFLCTRTSIGELRLRIGNNNELKVLDRLLQSPCQIEKFTVFPPSSFHQFAKEIQLFQQKLRSKTQPNSSLP